MILIFILLISFCSFAIRNGFFYSHRKFQSRRALTGAEIARYILDKKGLLQTTVEVSQKSGFGTQPVIRQLTLDKKIYDGRSLEAITQAARLAVMKAKWPHAIASLKLQGRGWLGRLSQIAVLLGWLALAMSYFFHRPFFCQLGTILFGTVLLFVIFDLPSEWEINETALLFLKQSQHFEVDELARIKNLLQGLRFSGLGQIFETPLSFFKVG